MVTLNQPRVRVKVVEPDPMDVSCPRCGETNIWRGASLPPVIMVQFIHDERGPHFECSCCSSAFSMQDAVGGGR